MLLTRGHGQPRSGYRTWQPLGLQQGKASFRASQFKSSPREQTLLTVTKFFGILYQRLLHWLALHDTLCCFELLYKILGGLWVLGGIWVLGGLLSSVNA